MVSDVIKQLVNEFLCKINQKGMWRSTDIQELMLSTAYSVALDASERAEAALNDNLPPGMEHIAAIVDRVIEKLEHGEHPK